MHRSERHRPTVPPLSLSLLALLIASAAPDARAGCPGPPRLQAVANSDPTILAACTGSPATCPAPAPPTVVAGSVRAQEAVLSTDLPAGFQPTKMFWMAERLDPVTGYQELWIDESKDGLTGVVGPVTLQFGAPGLRENAPHAFRVARCDASGCTCWSNRTTLTTTTDFSGLAPLSPSGTVYRIEDQFERPGTTGMCNVQASLRGDGLGPIEAWEDCRLTSPPGPSVASNGHAARFHPTSGSFAASRLADRNRSFAEAQVVVVEQPNHPIGSGFHYNFQVHTRDHLTTIGSSPSFFNGYVAKITYKVRGCSEDPILFLVRTDEYDTNAACNVGGPNDGDPKGPPDTFVRLRSVEGGPRCPLTILPPLSTEIGDTGVTEPVWLRIEVFDDFGGNPNVIGTIAWGTCPAGQGIDACDYVCTNGNPVNSNGWKTPRVDNSEIGRTYMAFDENREDNFGMSFHDKYYDVLIFRGGVEDP